MTSVGYVIKSRPESRPMASACFLLPPKSYQRTPCFLPFWGCHSSIRALPQNSGCCKLPKGDCQLPTLVTPPHPFQHQVISHILLGFQNLRFKPSGSLVTGMTPAPAKHRHSQTGPIQYHDPPFSSIQLDRSKDVFNSSTLPTPTLVCTHFALLRNTVLFGHLGLAASMAWPCCLNISHLTPIQPAGTQPPHHQGTSFREIWWQPCRLSSLGI